MSASNILLLTVDSLRADRVGCYGLRRGASLTPNLGRLAASSHVFSSAFSQGCYTSRAMPALFTGRYPCRLKAMKSAIRIEHADGVLVQGARTIPEALHGAGYHTAGFHSNPLLSRLFGFDKGFDYFFDDVLLSTSGLSQKIKLTAARAQRLFRADPYLSAGALHEQVIRWLKTAPQPFFLWIHYMDAHGPYLSHKILKYVSRGERLWRKAVFSPQRVTPSERAMLESNYQAQISRLDAEIGRLFDVLNQHISLHDALTIVTADHGDEFLEHGGFGHLAKPYDELLHVPLIARLPGQNAPRRINEITETIQIAPTILDFAGIPYNHLGFDAQSFLPLLLGNASDERSRAGAPEGSSRGEPYRGKGFAYSEAGPGPHDCVSIRTEKWKLILKRVPQRAANGNGEWLLADAQGEQTASPPAGRAGGGANEASTGNRVHPDAGLGSARDDLANYARELYDLARDPREQTNIAAQFPQVVSDLERHIQAHFAGADRQTERACAESEMIAAAGPGNHAALDPGERLGATLEQGEEPGAALAISEAEQALVEERLRDLGYI